MALNRESIIRAAEKYVSKGRLEAAIKEYRKVLAENPNDAKTLNRVGDLYARIERFSEAVKLFTQIAEQYTRDGFFVKAIAIYKKIIKLDPTSLPFYERLAELYYKQGLLNEARTQYQVLADYYQKHDNAATAITTYQKMSGMEPENPSFHLKLAELHQSQQLTDKALDEYRQLADLLIVNGSVDETTQVYLKALEVGSGEIRFISQAVVGLHDGGHVGAAAKVLARAVELNPAAAEVAEEVGLAEQKKEPAPEEAAAPQPPTPPDTVTPDRAPTPTAESPGPPVDLEETDETFIVPETSFAEFEGLDEPAFQPAAAEAEEDVFTFDLDDDAVPETLVQPPDDMVDQPATTEEEVEFDLQLELDEEAPASDDAVEVEWSLDEIELPAAEAEVDEAVPAVGGEIGLSLDFEPGFFDEEPVEASASATPGEPLAPEVFEIKIEGLESEAVPVPAEAPAAASAPPAVRREEDLLAEARVFAKYGLEEKAQDRLTELLDIHPNHLEGLELRARIHLQAGRSEEAIADANEVSRIATETGDPAPWQELRNELLKAGYSLEDEVVVDESEEKADEDDRIAQLLEDLSLEDFELPATTKTSTAAAEPAADTVPSALETPQASPAVRGAGGRDAGRGDSGGRRHARGRNIRSNVHGGASRGTADRGSEEARLTGRRARTGRAPGRRRRAVGSCPDGRGGAAAPAAAVPEQPAAETVPTPAAPPAEEPGMSWLDETGGDQATAAQADSIFAEEDDFFDLAAELERELIQDDLGGDAIAQPQEQSLEDIIEGFKQGVAENLSAEDYETHFNLGIAYREMGLLDEAIGEFQLASKEERYLVDCSSLLGLCFLDKGLPELAIRWYRKGLESPSINDEATLGLLYEMGNAYISLGDFEAAYKTLIEIYGRNSNYRDVSAKLQELRAATS